MEIDEQNCAAVECPYKVPHMVPQPNGLPGLWVPQGWSDVSKSFRCTGTACAAWRSLGNGKGYCGQAGALPMRFHS